MSDYTVIWHKSWQDRPVCSPERCQHECGEQLSINQRLEPKFAKRPDGPFKIALDGIVCMDCGTDTTGNFAIAEALRLCMDQHGWNREVGLRLYDLACAHAAELMASPAIPIWCLYAMGWSGREITKALNDGRLNPASMSEEIEQLSDKINPFRSAA